MPNAKYVDETGYQYITDTIGRVNSVDVDELVYQNAARNPYAQRTVGGADRLADDDGGHLIASMFNGSGDIDNLVPMHKSVNRAGGEWYAMEKEWQDALTDVPPRKVTDIRIEPIYHNDSLRPTSFKVQYQIEGRRRVKTIIENFPEGGHK